LLHLQSILLRHGKCITDFPFMPLSKVLIDYSYTNRLIFKEQSYDIDDLTQIVQTGIPQLNIEQ
ncbi:15087_t:CDS:1, partial [Cetraspora pellucida]